MKFDFRNSFKKYKLFIYRKRYTSTVKVLTYRFYSLIEAEKRASIIPVLHMICATCRLWSRVAKLVEPSQQQRFLPRNQSPTDRSDMSNRLQYSTSNKNMTSQWEKLLYQTNCKLHELSARKRSITHINNNTNSCNRSIAKALNIYIQKYEFSSKLARLQFLRMPIIVKPSKTVKI